MKYEEGLFTGMGKQAQQHIQDIIATKKIPLCEQEYLRKYPWWVQRVVSAKSKRTKIKAREAQGAAKGPDTRECNAWGLWKSMYKADTCP